MTRSSPSVMPTLFVVAGPNGCGKSTLTYMGGFSGIDIIDPDAIACDLGFGSPGRTAREALRRRIDALGEGRTHLVETTLAGSGILRHMEAARREDYWIVLHFVSVGSPELALDRVRNRVALGGHDVPEADVRRRFARSHNNLPAAISRADVALLYDNTDPDRPHREVAILGETIPWIAEAVPAWATAALAHTTALGPR